MVYKANHKAVMPDALRLLMVMSYGWQNAIIKINTLNTQPLKYLFLFHVK